MKKHYAYTVPEKYDSYPSSRLWRLFAFSFLCLLLYPVASLQANSKVENNAAADQLKVTIENAFGPGWIYCTNEKVTLVAIAYLNGVQQNSEQSSFSWVGPNGFKSTGSRIDVTVQGDYELTVQHASGLSTSAIYTVKGVVGAAGPDKVIRTSETSVKLAGNPASWAWFGFTPSWTASDGGNIVSDADTFTPSVNAPGTYTLTLTHTSGCTMQDSMVVTRAEDVFSARTTNEVLRFSCESESDRKPITLFCYTTLNGVEVREGVSFSWTGPNDYKSNTQGTAVTVAGTYTVVATHTATGLTATTSINVGEYIVPVGSAGPDKVLTCNNPTVTLEGSVINNSGSPSWNAGYDGGNIVSGHNTLNPVVDAPGTYYLTLYSGRCTTIYSVKVTREDELTVSATGGTLYPSSPVQLKGSSSAEGATYSWTGPNGFTSTEQNPTVNVAGKYTLTVTDPETGCTANAHAMVAVFSAHISSKITGEFDCSTSNTAYAELLGAAYFNEQYIIEGITFQWSGPNNFTDNKNVTRVNAPGTYTLLVTHIATGDTATASWTFAGPKLPVASAGPDKKLTCANSTVRLEGNMEVGDRVIWLASDGGNIVSDWDKLNPLVDAPGTYTMIVSFYTSRCTAEYTVKVTREEELTVSATGGKLNNGNGTVQLKGSSTSQNVTYSWAGPNGYTSNQQNPVVSEAGDYTLTVSKGQGCTATTTVTVEPSKGLAHGQNDKDVRVYPNPVKDRAQIEFKLKNKENYVVNLYDMNGNLVRELGAGTTKTGGPLSIVFDVSDLSDGLYIARIVSTSETKTVQVIVKK